MKVCGLLGRKLGHSYSPRIHSLLGDYAYGLYEKEPEDLEDFLKNGAWDGLNVTIPYKKTVLPYCTALSPLAEKLGNVNTLVRRPDGTIYGDNTDYWGFRYMAEGLGVDFREKKALVFGTGGASATVQAVLKDMGAKVTAISRTGENNYETLGRHRDARILVNATPLGMYPHNGESPVDLERFPQAEAVLDVVYNPARTRLILDAEQRGIPCRSGLAMLVGQAARAAEHFAGMEISREKIEEVQRKIALGMENLVLIGMPGSGKTTLGKALAERLGRDFADADGEIEKRIQMPIPDFFAKEGEAAFREVETQVLAELGKASGLVLATGGGAVTRPENYGLLHQNGQIVWVQRPLEDLPSHGRPVTQRDGVEALYRQRKGLYAQFADLTVENTGTLEETVEKILESRGGGK